METADISGEYNAIEEDYFDWLCRLVCTEDERLDYIFLLHALFKKEFYSILGNDDDRGEDGKVLRDEFGQKRKYNDMEIAAYIPGPCSILEMLIALARRMAFDTKELDKPDKTSMWFWDLIKNLGLDGLDDIHFVDEDGPKIVDQKMRKLLDRKYSKKGKGGLFPLKSTKIDQRKVEIWYQMSAYLSEKCDI